MQPLAGLSVKMEKSWLFFWYCYNFVYICVVIINSAVSISLDGNNIVIKAQPRQGWAEAAKRAHENGDDELLIPDVFEDEKFEDWTW